MAGVRKKANRGGKYQGWFTDARGKRKYFTGTRNRPETLGIAQRLEDEHRQVRLGHRPVRSAADKNRNKSIAEVMSEYLQWGEVQGGRDGAPGARNTRAIAARDCTGGKRHLS